MRRVIWMAVFLAGCATTETVQKAPVERDRVFLLQEDCTTVLTALPAALDSIHLTLEREDAPAPDCPVTVMARKGISAFSWGEIVRVSLTAAEPGVTELRVYTARALATNITARGDWSEHVHKALLAELSADDEAPGGQ